MVLEIETPSIDRSLSKDNTLIPYALVNIKVTANGYTDLLINGVQVLPFEKSIQVVNLIKSPLARESGQNVEFEEIINISPNVQYGIYPPKIPEDPTKPLPPPPSGLVVLPEPIIPEYIIVHAGAQTDSSAPRYKVSYTDYLKNVASSEIYATWYKISAIYTGVTRIAELKGADIGEVRQYENEQEYEYFIPLVPRSEISEMQRVKYPTK